MFSHQREYRNYGNKGTSGRTSVVVLHKSGEFLFILVFGHLLRVHLAFLYKPGTEFRLF